jgi:hypothetical protein
MGTNFYWKMTETPSVTLPTGKVKEDFIDDMDPDIHIGKRSAAGTYCWDCRRTLCPGGEANIHRTEGPFLTECPECGGKVQKEARNPAMVELGFEKPAEEPPPSGVHGVCSFTWAQEKAPVVKACKERPDEVLIVDEYREELTGAQFLQMLEANCPIQFFDAIGRQFC